MIDIEEITDYFTNTTGIVLSQEDKELAEAFYKLGIIHASENEDLANEIKERGKCEICGESLYFTPERGETSICDNCFQDSF